MNEQGEETQLSEAPRTGSPNPARGVGYLWLFFSAGALAFGVWRVLSIGQDPNLEEQQRGLGLIAWGFALIPLGILACAVLWAGIRTTFGMAPDTLGNGIGSIGFGAVLGYYTGKGWVKHGFQDELLIFAVPAIVLIVAGVWALLVRGAYLRWKVRA